MIFCKAARLNWLLFVVFALKCMATLRSYRLTAHRDIRSPGTYFFFAGIIKANCVPYLAWREIHLSILHRRWVRVLLVPFSRLAILQRRCQGSIIDTLVSIKKTTFQEVSYEYKGAESSTAGWEECRECPSQWLVSWAVWYNIWAVSWNRGVPVLRRQSSY